MPLRISLSLLGLVLLAGVVLAAFQVLDTITGDHDGWDIFAPVGVMTVRTSIEPANLLGSARRETLDEVVQQARNHGIPLSVHVIGASGGGNPPDADEIAAQRFAEQPAETFEGAGDGLLMVVVVPRDDRTATDVAFVTGPNFYPKGGITPERLDYIADVQMGALIQENRIGDAVVEGATWVVWTQLFEPTPDAPATNLERGLQELLVPFGAAVAAALAGVVGIAAAAVQARTWRGAGVAPDPDRFGGVVAAAARRGRVDNAVVAGIVLDAIDRGVLSIDDRGALAAHPDAGQSGTPWDAALADVVRDIESGGEPATTQALHTRLLNDSRLRHEVEDALASGGLYFPKSPRDTIALRAIAAGGILLGSVLVVVSVIGEAAPALGASVALAGISIVVLIWNERRAWTTRGGRRAVRRWLDSHTAPDDRERALYETIVGMETIDLLPTGDAPLRPGAQRLASSLSPP